MQFCENCGQRLNPGARFCPACGAASADAEATRVAPSEETRVATRTTTTPQALASDPQAYAHAPNLPARGHAEDSEEKIIFTVRPTLLFVKIGYALAALCGVLLVALLGWLAPDTVSLYVLIPFALALLLIPAFFHLKRMMVRYTLTDAKIEIDRGFISQTTRNLPLRNIKDVTVTTTIFQRLLGFGDVVIDNAGTEGGTTILDDIPDPRRHADLLLRELRRWH
jgi:uncharacterized membrane protein YdbT with pleckstrin-like domain